jgi:hypothetical protein
MDLGPTPNMVRIKQILTPREEPIIVMFALMIHWRCDYEARRAFQDLSKPVQNLLIADFDRIDKSVSEYLTR